ncbi:MAG TPA: hypothetical protein VN697_14365, partial [Tepidiformaceae bacterium]|nr:hypothetical protein [Tepidiformaceae bacterium]
MSIPSRQTTAKWSTGAGTLLSKAERADDVAAVTAADGAAMENDLRIAEINDVASVASELSTGLRARGHEVVLFQPKLAGGHLPGFIKPAVVPMRALEWAQLV